jgi:hypothetical protein
MGSGIEIQAKGALRAIETVIQAASQLPNWVTHRSYVATALLRASMDHGLSQALLFSMPQDDFGASALALHRCQMETCLRGIFFAGPATEEEVQYFIQYDDMPKRSDDQGKHQKLGPNALTPLVSAALHIEDPDVLPKMVKSTWGPMNGMVHGGTSILALYFNQGHTHFKLPAEHAMPMLINSVALCNFALAGFAMMSIKSESEKSELFKIAKISCDEFLASVAEHS